MSEQEVVRYFTDRGIRTAIVSEGRKKLSVVLIDSPVRRTFVDKSERRYMTSMDYPLAKAKRIYRRAGKRLGMNKTARKLLKG